MQLIDMYLEFMFSTAIVRHRDKGRIVSLFLNYSDGYNLESVRHVIVYLIKFFQTQYENTETLTVFNFSIPSKYKLQIDRLTVHFEKCEILMSLAYEPGSKEAGLVSFLKEEFQKAAPGFKIKVGKDNW